MEVAWRAKRCGCATIRRRVNWDIEPVPPGGLCKRQSNGFKRTVTVRTWLLVAAERRELEGILSRFGTASKLEWPGAKFARATERNGDRWWMIASGPGPRLVEKAMAEKKNVNGIINTGFCGALDPTLRVGDIVVSGDAAVASGAPFVRGEIFSADRVAVTAAEKRALRN